MDDDGDVGGSKGDHDYEMRTEVGVDSSSISGGDVLREDEQRPEETRSPTRPAATTTVAATVAGAAAAKANAGEAEGVGGSDKSVHGRGRKTGGEARPAVVNVPAVTAARTPSTSATTASTASRSFRASFSSSSVISHGSASSPILASSPLASPLLSSSCCSSASSPPRSALPSPPFPATAPGAGGTEAGPGSCWKQLAVAEGKEERDCIEEKVVDHRRTGGADDGGGGGSGDGACMDRRQRWPPSSRSSPLPGPAADCCSSSSACPRAEKHDDPADLSSAAPSAAVVASASAAAAKTNREEGEPSPSTPSECAARSASIETAATELARLSGELAEGAAVAAAASREGAGDEGVVEAAVEALVVAGTAAGAVAVAMPTVSAIASASTSVSSSNSSSAAASVGQGGAEEPAARAASSLTMGYSARGRGAEPTASLPSTLAGAATTEQLGTASSFRHVFDTSEARASEGGGGGGFARPRRTVSASTYSLGDVHWRNSWVGGGSFVDVNTSWGGFGHSASWRARMNQPLAWDAVMLPSSLIDAAPAASAITAANGGAGGGRVREARASSEMGAGGGRSTSGAARNFLELGGGSGGGSDSGGTGRFLLGVERSQRLSEDGRPRLIGGSVEEGEDDAEEGAEVDEERGGNGGRVVEEMPPGEACFEAFCVSEDVTVAILGDLDARDLARAAATSRGWRRCTSSRILWAAVYARDFLGHVTPPENRKAVIDVISAVTAAANGGRNGDGGGGGGGIAGAHQQQHQYRHRPLRISRFHAAAAGAAAATGGAGAATASGDHPHDFFRAVWPQPYSSSSSLSRGHHGRGNGRFSYLSGGAGGGGAGGLPRYDGSAAGGALGGGEGGDRRTYFFGDGLDFGGGKGGGGGVNGGGRGVMLGFEENPKEQYAKQLMERKARLERQQRQEVLREARKRADRRRRGYERGLDCLHVRLLPPILGMSLALTLVFLAAWIDGELQEWDYWRVLSPMWVACAMVAAAVATAVRAWRERAVQSLSARSTYSGLRGVVRYFMTDVVHDHVIGIISGITLLVLFTLQLLLLGLRVDGISHANWFAVFTPLFLCFVILCLSPCLQWASWGDGGVYLLGMLLGWLPAVLCAVLVCSRLQGDDISMTVVMSPLWAVDLVVILAPVAMAIALAVRRMRRGEPAEAMLVHTLAASWCLLTPVLAPVVAFEIMLAVYVERDTLTAAEVFTPLIVWCCVLSLILCGYSCSYPPRHPDPQDGHGGSLDHDDSMSSFAPTPRGGFATRLPRPTVSASVGGLGGGGRGVGGYGAGAGRNRRRQLPFPPSTMSPLPASLTSQQQQHHHHHHPPPRPLTPAPHANNVNTSGGSNNSSNNANNYSSAGGGAGLAPDMANIVALRSQLAELGVMAGFLDPSPTVGPAGGGVGGGVGHFRRGGGSRAAAVARSMPTAAQIPAPGVERDSAAARDDSGVDSDDATNGGRGRTDGEGSSIEPPAVDPSAFDAWDYFGGFGMGQRGRDDEWAV